MSEDNLDLLEALGSLARDQQREHEHLEELCAGGQRPAASAAQAQSATQPLSSDEQAQIADRIRHALKVDRWRAVQPANNTQGSANSRAPLQLVSSAPPVSHGPGSRARRLHVLQWTGLLLPLVAAAAVALLFQTTAPIAALPEYSLQARASQEYRAEPAANAPLRVEPGTALRIELRPSTQTEGPVDLRVQLHHAGGSSEWPAQIERSPQGSLRLTLARADIAVQGSAELRIVLARPEVLAKLGYQEVIGQRGEGWQAWRVPVQLP